MQEKMVQNCDSLQTALSAFKGVTSIDGEKQKYAELARQFKDVAKRVLFGGYFKINNIRKIYPIEIEFYYHEESPDGLKDPVMYHTKEHTKDKNLPYFPLGSLNFHVSGMDVTFEKEGEYRASFLIREYRVYDLVNQEWKDGKRPTYIYEDMLMGIPIFEGIHIQWIPEKETLKDWKSNPKWRINVADYQRDDDRKYTRDKNGNYIKNEINKEDYKKLPETERQEYFKYSGKIFKKCTRLWNYRK